MHTESFSSTQKSRKLNKKALLAGWMMTEAGPEPKLNYARVHLEKKYNVSYFSLNI